MEITLNGQPHQVDAGTSLLALLESTGYGDRKVAVELNREVIPRSRHAQHLIAAGDRIEVIHAIGGG